MQPMSVHMAEGPDQRSGHREQPALGGGSWTFLTNHAHVLICLAGDPTLRIRDLAVWVGITERAVHRILSELAASGYVTRVRDGRRNHYHLDLDLPMRHVLERSHPVRNLTGAVAVYPVDRGGPQ